MATREVLQNGTTANDGTGDTLRDAADKINTNFVSIWNALGGRDSYFTDGFHVDSDGNIVFDTGTYNTTLTAGSPTGNRTVTLPNATGTVSLITATETLTNKTLTTPIVDVLFDSNSNEAIKFNGAGPSSVNYFELINGDSTTGITICAQGDSGDVDIHLLPMNGGVIKADSRIVQTTETLTTAGAASVALPTTILNSGSGFAVSLADGTNVGDEKKFVNINSGTATITPASFAGFTQFTVATNAACVLIWSGTNWHLVQDTGVTAS